MKVKTWILGLIMMIPCLIEGCWLMVVYFPYMLMYVPGSRAYEFAVPADVMMLYGGSFFWSGFVLVWLGIYAFVFAIFRDLKRLERQRTEPRPEQAIHRIGMASFALTLAWLACFMSSLYVNVFYTRLDEGFIMLNILTGSSWQLVVGFIALESIMFLAAIGCTLIFLVNIQILKDRDVKNKPTNIIQLGIFEGVLAIIHDVRRLKQQKIKLRSKETILKLNIASFTLVIVTLALFIILSCVIMFNTRLNEGFTISNFSTEAHWQLVVIYIALESVIFLATLSCTEVLLSILRTFKDQGMKNKPRDSLQHEVAETIKKIKKTSPNSLDNKS